MRLKPPTLKCPFCDAIITDRYLANEPLTCRNCQRQLMISPGRLDLTSVGATAVTILLCLLLGLRGIRFFVAVVVLWFPLLVMWAVLLNALVPPGLEPYRAPKKPNDEDTYSSDLDMFHR
jgi:hypothetical protein